MVLLAACHSDRTPEPAEATGTSVPGVATSAGPASPAETAGTNEPTTASTPAVQVEVTAEPPVVLRETDGLRLDRQIWHLGPQRGWAWRVRVPLPGEIRIVAATQAVPFEDLLPTDPGPWAAIDGGFFDTDGRPMGLVVADGSEISPIAPAGGSGILVVDESGPRIIHRDDWSPGASQALQSIDRLIDGGRSVVASRDDDTAARSAIVIGREYIWLVVIVDNESARATTEGFWLRYANQRGIPLWAFADYLVANTDAVTALNLDGGRSSHLAVRIGEQQYRVANQSTVANAIVVRPVLGEPSEEPSHD